MAEQHMPKKIQKAKGSPINIRALEIQKALIDKAAVILNKTRSDFMLEASCREAEHVLLDRRLFLVDDDSYKEFLLILESPVDENLGLRSLMNRKAPWEK